MKILHCADLHLDSPIKGLNSSEKSKIRRAELRETFYKILNFAAQKEVDAVLIAGDLFDNADASFSTLEFLKGAMEEKKDIRFFISPGNHDYYGGEFSYAKINMPKNVHVFKDEIEKIELSPGINIYGFGFFSDTQKKSLLKGFRAEDVNDINIMLMHADLFRGEHYNPITKQEIEMSGLSYIALGHIHKYSGMQKAGKTYYAYPGIPEPRGFDEEGDKGFLLLDIEKDLFEYEFVSLQKRKMRVVDIDISAIKSIENIVEEIREKITDSKDLYKIILSGENNAGAIDCAVISALVCENAFFVKLEDNSKENIDYEKEALSMSLKGRFTKRMLERMGEGRENEEVLKLALKYGYLSLLGEKVDKK